MPLSPDAEGFPPARAMVVSFREWIHAAEDELRQMRENRFAFLRDVDAVARTEQEISELVQSDTARFVSWLKTTGKVGSSDFRSFERARLEEKLPNNRHAREVAIGALASLETEIDILAKRVEYLRQKLPAYTSDAILEAAGPGLAREYTNGINALEATIAKMLGLARVARTSAEADDGFSPFGYYAGLTFEVALPRFRLDGLPELPAIRADNAKVAAAAVPWAELADLWGHNPRADLPELK